MKTLTFVKTLTKWYFRENPNKQVRRQWKPQQLCGQDSGTGKGNDQPQTTVMQHPMVSAPHTDYLAQIRRCLSGQTCHGRDFRRHPVTGS